MLRRSFLWKLYGSYAALVLVSAAVIGTLVLSHLREQTLRETETSLYRTARLLASMEAANPAHLWSPELSLQIGEVAAETGLHVSLFFANGTPVAESGALGPVLPARVLEFQEIAGARRSSRGRAIRPLVAAGAEHMFIAVPILLEYEIIGYATGRPPAGLGARAAVGPAEPGPCRGLGLRAGRPRSGFLFRAPHDATPRRDRTHRGAAGPG
jgi:hypothetical protein